jgi:DNA-binding response OmpR family regulator
MYNERGLKIMHNFNHILLIEDDPSIAKPLITGLAREGFQVAWESKGEPGINYACEQHPHLILLDVRLPDGSGFDFCARMRQLGLSLPIIMVTVQRDEIDKVLGLEKGADDYITKPFSFRELTSRIRAQLRRAYGELSVVGADVLRIGDIIIDQPSGKVSKGGEDINLGPTGFRLLIYLLRHRGQALTRSQIIEEVWGYAHTSDSERIVDIQVSRLRQKLEIDPKHPRLIETVPGIGYRLTK